MVPWEAFLLHLTEKKGYRVLVAPSFDGDRCVSHPAVYSSGAIGVTIHELVGVQESNCIIAKDSPAESGVALHIRFCPDTAKRCAEQPSPRYLGLHSALVEVLAQRPLTPYSHTMRLGCSALERWVDVLAEYLLDGLCPTG